MKLQTKVHEIQNTNTKHKSWQPKPKRVQNQEQRMLKIQKKKINKSTNQRSTNRQEHGGNRSHRTETHDQTDKLTKSEGEHTGVGRGAGGETLGTRQC